MKNQTPPFTQSIPVCLLAAWLGWAANSQSALLISFPFNEGSGSNVTDTASGLVAAFGTQQNPAVDYVQLSDASPSGLSGDRCITNSGGGFLLADDSTNKVLNIPNGPITIESWIYIDPFTPAKAAEGIAAYGNSYKMGMKGGYQVFTLFGIVDITNAVAGQVPAGQWVHLAAAWEPGAGVHFYLNGTEYFEANTNSAARPVSHNYLSIASEGFANNSVAAFDRIRIHHALLTGADLDSVAATPKAPLAGTIVAYNFDEAAFPSTNAIAPALPTILSSAFLPSITSPAWTNDTPTGLPGDFALAFLTDRPPIFESAFAPFGSTVIDLGANNTNYTLQAWVKLPTGPMEERRVIYFTGGSPPRVSLSINANRALHTTLYGNTDFASSVFVPNDNRWHHVAAVMENFARVRFYLDGILRQTINRTATGALNATATPGLTIGKESETRYFRGVLDRILIYNDALTNSTIDFPAIPGLATFNTFASHPVDVTTNAGATVAFTATPSSASPASYQWHYRTNLADHVTVPLPGQTSTTLTLSNISAGNLGFYSLVVSNAAGVSESYAARLRLTPDLSGKLFSFEPPTYASGLLEGQDDWTNDQNGNAVRVQTASEIAAALTAAGLTPGTTVHSGAQALLVSGGGVASTTIRTITGLESQSKVTLDVWVRPLVGGNTGAPIGNTFFTVENSAGTRAAAFRLGPAQSIDYGTAITGVWQATGQLWDPNSWYHITMRLDYGTRTYDFLINDVQVNASPIAFYVSTSDSFRQVRIFRGANQAGMIVDDLNVPPRLRIANIAVTGATVTVTWAGGQPPYQLQRRNNLTAGNWENVGDPTNATQATDAIGPGSMFYRVWSN
jgi:hypothetical protein